jgi:glycosyltransferase involved in cell wall biosynthesis
MTFVAIKKSRVAVVISHPIQHFVHLYKALAKEGSVELKVFFAAKIGVKPYFDKEMNIEIQWATDLLTGYDYTFLPEAEGISETGFTQINNPSIIPALKDFAPNVVHVHGYAQLTTLRAILWCNFHKIPVLLSADSSLLFKRPPWKQFIKDLLLPQFMRLFYGVISTGDNNTAYYQHYGIKANRIFSCPFTIDELALGQAKSQKSQLRAQVRAQYGIADDELVLLFVGKLAPWKSPQDFLDALAIAQKELGSSVKLVAFFAGNGLLLEELQASAISQNLRAIFAGFINLDILPTIYAMADALVFPSQREAYGLSAREAIFLGLPLIVSDQVGCVGKTDAARPNINAEVYPSRNVPLLANAIVSVVSNPQKLASMAAASERIAAEMNHDKSVAGYISAISSAYQK